MSAGSSPEKLAAVVPPQPSSADDLPNDLPPVQPPSVGFLFQLFVVPAIIVLAVVGLWALFGRMAASEQDWRKLVTDLQSANPQVRDRSMYGLAQMLTADQKQGEAGQHLASNPEITQALVTQLKTELQSTKPEANAARVYLCRVLGTLHDPRQTLPVLIVALQPNFDDEVRKSAIASLAMIGGQQETLRMVDDVAGKSIFDLTVAALVDFSQDPRPETRRAGAFALGLYVDPESIQRLEVMVEDADFLVTVNAAIALARQHNTKGWPVIERVLTAETRNEALHDRVHEVEALTVLNNILKAVKLLARDFSGAQRSALQKWLESLSREHRESRIRIEAAAALAEIKLAGV